MFTVVHFLTTFVHLVDALWLTTDVFKSWVGTKRSTFNFFITESALTSFFKMLKLFTSLAQMVRCDLAQYAEVGRALLTPQSVFTHMLGSLFG